MEVIWSLPQMSNESMPKIMGIINVTPDSFSDGGRFLDPQLAIDQGVRLVEDGADILDIGGESTRPGSVTISIDEELSRVIPVIEGLRALTDRPISIDTRKPAVASAAISAGADIWNDVSALTFDETSVETAAALGCQIVLMHAQGDPATMQNNPYYRDVVSEVMAFLAGRIELSAAAGIDRRKITIDPGIGFGKRPQDNIDLIAGLRRLQSLGQPVLLGASRKRFIAAIDRESDAEKRIGGSIAAAMVAARHGAAILRVHDVAETRQALAVYAALSASHSGD